MVGDPGHRSGEGLPAMNASLRPIEATLSDDHRHHNAISRECLSPHLFVVLDGACIGSGGARYSLANIDAVAVGRGDRRSSRRHWDAGVRVLSMVLPDRRVSHRHLELRREGDDFIVGDCGSRNGTRLNGERLTNRTRLADGDVLETGSTMLQFRAAIPVPLSEAADVDTSAVVDAPLLLTLNPSLASATRSLERLARSLASVLVLGETGTGKELLARAIHVASGRRGPFVAVNCGALPPTLLEAHLFGHVRGAFSGAVSDAPGLVRTADGGTLFLDEIGDLALPSQAALLRVLQEREVLPVGGTQVRRVDLRVVAATLRPLEELVARREFREDLYGRLAEYVFRLPALRDRREDLGVLLSKVDGVGQGALSPAAARALLRYEWPRNVRELHHVIRVARTLANGETIEPEHLPPVLRALATVDPLRRRLIGALERHRGNVSEVARELGKARMQIQRWMKRFDIEPSPFRKGSTGDAATRPGKVREVGPLK